MNHLEIRPMTALDVDSAQRMEYQHSLPTNVSGLTHPDLLNVLGSSHGKLHVATIDHVVVGYTLSVWLLNRIRIQWIRVHADYIRQGVGTALVRHLVDQASRLDMESVVCLIRKRDTGAQKFFHKLGFSCGPVFENWFSQDMVCCDVRADAGQAMEMSIPPRKRRAVKV